jgi:hypothetical protein
LKFSEWAGEATRGGVAVLELDPGLASLEEGEAIQVEGSFDTKNYLPETAGLEPKPRYRVGNISRVR